MRTNEIGKISRHRALAHQDSALRIPSASLASFWRIHSLAPEFRLENKGFVKPLVRTKPHTHQSRSIHLDS